MPTSPSPRLLCAALAAALLLFAPLPAVASHTIIAPTDGAIIAEPSAWFIGVGTHDELTVTLNGTRIPVSRVGDAFTARLGLRPGRNLVVASAGPDDTTTVTVVHDPAATQGRYIYHEPLLDGDCKDCHPRGVGRTAAVEAKLCRSCHDPKGGERYVHGPIGAGQCTVCHDPHGSARAAFLRLATRELCQSCHDQNRTKEHVERAGARLCTECHDPHGSGKQYLLY